MRNPSFRTWLALGLAALGSGATATARDKHLLLIAGPASHPPGTHEHTAGVLLLQKCLRTVPNLHVEVSLKDWPRAPDAVERADAILIYADGGRHHPALAADRLAQLEAFAARGGGIGLMHYAVEPTPEKGRTEFLRWIGGCFETHWSVNPHWTAEFRALPAHPITRGVRPFSIEDEWYFHMRFVEDQRHLTPLLSAVPPESTMTRPDGPHSGNPAVRRAVARGEPQIVAWAYERADGGRGFGFTGAHNHVNWGNDNFRRLVLNALLWLAKIDVPEDGVASSLTVDDLKANLDPK